jgi:hypothetical protein
MNTQICERKWHMAVKVEIKKVYDRVEWPFLEAMMRTMSFEER